VTILVLNYDKGKSTDRTWQMGDIARYDGKVDDNDVTVLALNYGSGWKAGMGGPLGGVSGGLEENVAPVGATTTTGGVSLAFAATGEVAPPRSAPPLAADDGIVDLLAAPAMSL
jgi:hypothetical protein